MGLLDRLHARQSAQVMTPALEFYNKSATVSADPAASAPGSDSDTLSLEARNEKEVQQNPNSITEDAQLGQRKAEAAALVWSRTSLTAIYGWVWLCFFLLAFQSAVLNYASYSAYVNFQNAPALSIAQVLSSIIGGVIKLPIAKTLNLWGRAEGLLVFVMVYTIGLVVLASSSGPSSYAAGNVLYGIGYGSVYYILQVFIADTSGLKHRAFWWAFASTPFIITAFTGSLAGQAYLTNSTWQWAIGTFAILVPVIISPLAIVLKLYERRAQKVGLFIRQPSRRTAVQSIIHYFWQFDIIGCFLLMLAFILFLLPFSLQSAGLADYDSATFIAMIVIGVCVFPVFYAWERYGAPVHFIRWELLRERTVIGACGVAAIAFFSFYSWDFNFYNFLLVVYNLPIKYAGYVTSIYDVGSCFWGVVFGLWVLWTRHFKNACVFFGLPLMILGAGLMIKFRGQDADLGYIIMTQIFIAFGGGTIVIGQEMAVMAAADRDGVPMMLSLLGLFSSVGGAIGYAVSAAILSNVWPAALASRLPADQQVLVTPLYLGGYGPQLDFPVGSPIRNALNFAWGETQKWGSVSAVCSLALAIPCVLVWKNYNVDRKQNKGTMM